MEPVPAVDRDVPTTSAKVVARLQGLGHTLPAPPAPAGHYTGAVVDGDHVHLSGHTDRGRAGRNGGGPLRDEEPEIAVARSAAEHAAVHLLASAAAVADLDDLEVVHLRGYVAAEPTFASHPRVVDAASLLLHEVLGGRPHTRAALGVASLPGGAVVELEATFARRDRDGGGT